MACEMGCSELMAGVRSMGCSEIGVTPVKFC